MTSLGKVAPGNGLVLLFGEVDDRLHRQVIEPPMPLSDFVYRCDSEFFLDPLYRMTETRDTYGILVLDLAEATLGYITGTVIKTYTQIESRVPNKHHHGGMSSLRFERLRDDAINEYFKRISDRCTEAFLDQGLMGIIVGGPAMTKDDFMAGNYLHHELRKRVIGVVDVGYTDENGLREAMNAAKGLLANSEYLREKEVLDRFWAELGRDGLVVCGLEKTAELLRRGQVDEVIVSDVLDLKAIEEISETAESYRTKVLVVSDESEQGKMFASAIKVGGILRYK